MNLEGAPRYSLILETVTGDKYYFDMKIGNFVKIDSKSKITKASIQAFDFFTSGFINKYDLAENYGITDEVKRVYLSYNFKGEKKIGAVFCNPVWSHIASTSVSSKVDFRDKQNESAFNDVYLELVNPDSSFADFLFDSKNKINMSQALRSILTFLLAHENAYNMKKKLGFVEGCRAMDVYVEDRKGYYLDLKKCLSNYREFRSIYLNYCRYKGLEETNKVNFTEEAKPKKKALVNPMQISMFD